MCAVPIINLCTNSPPREMGPEQMPRGSMGWALVELTDALRSFVKNLKFLSIEMWFTSLALMFLHSILCLPVLHYLHYSKTNRSLCQNGGLAGETHPRLFSFKRFGCLVSENYFERKEAS